MKIKETQRKKDGTVISREISIPLKKGRSSICHTLVPTTDEPIVIKIVEAGWYDGGPTFHLITEYGDYMTSDYSFETLEQLTKKYPEFIEIWEDAIWSKK